MSLKSLFKFNINKKMLHVATHVVVWLFAILSTLLETEEYVVRINFDKINFSIWITYLYVFYVSYLYLIPEFFFKKRNVLYVLLSILLIGTGYCGIKTWHLYMKHVEIETFIEVADDVLRLDTLPSEADLRVIFDGKFVSVNEGGGPNPSRLPYFLSSKDELVKEVGKLKNLNIRSFTFNRYDPFTMRNIGLIYGILFIFSLSIILRFLQRTKKEEERALALQQEKVTSELEYLKQQINPHFLFNALNSIYSLTILNSEKSSDAVLKLSSILRYMLYETDKERVLLEDEIEVIENYLGLQRLRLTQKTVVKFEKIGDFAPYRIEPMLLVPILENAFKYGVDSSKDSEIDISLRVKDERLYFGCTNIIVKQNSDSKNSGIGIKNIRRRLDLLYGKQYLFNTEVKDDNFVVNLELPMGER